MNQLLSILNTQKNRDTSFTKEGGCYISNDPRLLSASRGIYTPIDNPPITHDTNLCEIHQGFGNFKTGFYDNYNSIQNGDVSYYYNNDSKSDSLDTFDRTNSYTYVDPMGNPTHYMKHGQSMLTKVDESELYCPKWLSDSTNYRNDRLFAGLRRNISTSWKR